jgi:hypothetical protein
MALVANGSFPVDYQCPPFAVYSVGFGVVLMAREVQAVSHGLRVSFAV